MDLVIVTGAGRGIGKQVAVELGSSGYFVLCVSKSNNAESTAKEIIDLGGKAESIKVDLSDYESVESKISTWLKSNSYKNISVVLAAAILGPKEPFNTNDLNEWNTAFKVNILGNLAVLKSVMPAMTSENYGRIVFFAGGGAAYANPTFPAYAATKTATVRVAENIHEEVKDYTNISVVCLAPGAVQTDMLNEFKSSGGKVLKVVDISEPVNFIKSFIKSKKSDLSGRFVHVRNDWNKYLNGESFDDDSMWKLRRIE